MEQTKYEYQIKITEIFRQIKDLREAIQNESVLNNIPQDFITLYPNMLGLLQDAVNMEVMINQVYTEMVKNSGTIP